MNTSSHKFPRFRFSGFSGKGAASFLIIILFLSVSAAAQNLNPSGIKPVQNFPPYIYRGSVQNWAVTQDSAGIMYFANNSGIMIYDGSEWQIIKMDNDATVRMVNYGNDNRVYVGAVSRLGFLYRDPQNRIKYKALENLIPEEHREFLDVWDILFTDNEVVFRTDKYLYIWDGKKFSVLTAGKYFTGSAKVNGKILIYDSGGGVKEYKNGKLTRFTDDPRIFNFDFISVISPDSATILMCAYEGGILAYRNGEVTEFAPALKNFFRENFIYKAIILPDGKIAFATFKGGIMITDNKGNPVFHITDKNGLRTNIIFDVFSDREKNLWAATDDGITRISYGSGITLLYPGYGLPKGTVSGFIKNNNLFISAPFGVYSGRTDGSSFEFSKLPQINDESWDITSFEDNSVLISTSQGLFSYDGAGLSQLSGTYTFTALPLKKYPGHILCGKDDGIYLLEKDETGKWQKAGELPVYDECRRFVEDKNGNVWVETGNSGILKLDFSTSLLRPIITGFRGQSPLYNKPVSLYNAGGYIFIATDSAVYYVTGDLKSIRKMEIEISFRQDDNIPILTGDNMGNIWLHDLGRICKLEISGSKAEIRENYYIGMIAKYDIFGMTVFQDKDFEKVFLTSNEGLFLFQLKNHTRREISFNLSIRKIEVNKNVFYQGDLIQGGDPFEFSYDRNYITFSFAALTYIGDGSVEYYTRLEGFEENWVNEKGRNFREYINLPPGRYRFMVKAVNSAGLTSYANVEFEINQAWYLTTAAYIFYILLLLAGTVFYIRTRTRFLEKTNSELEKRVHERTAQFEKAANDLSLLNDQLKSKNQNLEKLNNDKNEYLSIAAHDIKNPLSSIMGYSEILFEDTESLNHEEIRNYGKNIHQNSSNIISIIEKLLDADTIESGRITVDEEVFDLRELIAELITTNSLHCKSKSIKVEYDEPSEPAKVRSDYNLSLQILDNIFSNACKYTFSNTQITIRLNGSESGRIISVTDQGPGILPEEREFVFKKFARLSNRPTGDESSTGLGLSIVKMLCDKLGHKVWFESTPGLGTTFYVEFKSDI